MKGHSSVARVIVGGLCGRCAHAREIVSGRGSRFVLCGRSRDDLRYPRYPQLPVLRCESFEPAPLSADFGLTE